MMGVRHFSLLIPEMLPDVHGECAGSTAESNTLRSVLPSIAVSAKQLATVLGYVGGVQEFVAKTALEAGLMPFRISGDPFLGSVD